MNFDLFTNMETQSNMTLNIWREKFSRKEISQDDIDRLNTISREEREAILKAIPISEEVFMYLSIDEDVEGNLFFVRG